MIICKECGFASNRLQWTHFKYNCSGRFKNGKEYQLEYPGELLVDPSLSKKTAVTLDNLKKKYGDIEGDIKWQEYKNKQAYSNSFEYKKNKLGWSEDQFTEYNKSRAVTLKNMIAAHGEIDGIEKWGEYCDRQRYTNTKNYFIEKYGNVVGTNKYLEVNKQKASNNPKLLAEKLSITVDQAVDLICSRSSLRYNSNVEKEFIKLVESQLGPLDHSSLKSPFGKWCHDLDKYVVYDIQHKDCIIEFNGDYWHANPAFYSDKDTIRGRPVYDIWNAELKKINLAKDLGYRVLVVWESNYNADKFKTVKEVIKWILNEQS